MERQPFPSGPARPPQSRFPWPIVALAVAAALLIITFWLTPRTNKAATSALNDSMEPSAQVRISDVRISPQKVNQQANVIVYGEATNTGERPVTQAIVSAVFRDKDGHPLVAQQQLMERADASGGKVEAAKPSPNSP